MNEQTARGRHDEHALERAYLQKLLRRHEHDVRLAERARVLAAMWPSEVDDDTGFCPGGGKV
jgi:hypothetical protein